MKLSVRLSNAGMMSIIGLVIAVLLLTDINSHREHVIVMPGMQTSSGVVDKVVTKEFVLVDDDGNQRARIGMNDVNGPAMQLFDKHGQQRAMIRLNKDDVPSMRLYDEDGKLRSVTGFDLRSLEPQFIVFDGNGNGRSVSTSSHYTYSSLDRIYHDEDLVRNGLLTPYYGEPIPPQVHFEISSDNIRLNDTVEVNGNAEVTGDSSETPRVDTNTDTSNR
jgi:hypothetical protein